MAYFETSDGQKIYYDDWGAGDPIVFIHGWPLSGSMWEYQMLDLSERGYRCIAHDRRGFGNSDKPYTGYGFDRLGLDLAELLEKLDLRNVTLVGFSMGGGEVLEYLARHNKNKRVSKAVLAASVVPLLVRTDDHTEGVEEQEFYKMIEGIRTDRPAFLTDFAETFFGVGMLSSPVSMPMLAATCESAMRSSAKAMVECVNTFSTTDFRDDLASVNVPVLIIHGDSDKTVPLAATGEKAAAGIPGARLIVYPGAPHGLFYTERDRFTEDIDAFCSGRKTLSPSPELAYGVTPLTA
jgi:non-heme chloroperoxidase